MLGIVIVTYHSQELTVDFVLRQLPKIDCPWCALVLNQDSTEEETNLLAQRCHGVTQGMNDEIENYTVFFLSQRDNLGYACGNNLGARELIERRKDITELLFTNTDIEILERPNLSLLLSKKAEIPDCGVIGPRIIDKKNVEQGPFIELPSIWRKIVSKAFPYLRWLRCRTQRPVATVPAREGPTLFLHGSFVVVDRMAFQQVDGYDPRTFLYGEELLLALRMKKAGWIEYYAPLFTVLHAEGGSTVNSAVFYRKDAIATDSHRVYFKYYAGVSWISLLCFDIVEWCYRHFLKYFSLEK